MKKNEIKVGGHYRAEVNGKLVTVRVDAIEERGAGTSRNSRPSYQVTNLSTGRKLTFRSAAKFHAEMGQPISAIKFGKPKPKVNIAQFGSPQTGFPEDGGTVGGPGFLPEVEHRSEVTNASTS